MASNITSDSLINIDTPFKVEAGPGAGKTRWLINHIKNVLLNSTILNGCNKIACITYTNIAVDEIKNRLNEKGDTVEISTIHSFLYKNLIKPYVYLLKDSAGNQIEFDLANLDGHEEHIPHFDVVKDWLDNHCPRQNNRSNLYLLNNNQNKLYKILAGLKYSFNSNNELDLKINSNNLNLANKIQFPTSRITSQHFINYKERYWYKGIIDHEDVLYLSYQLIIQYPILKEFISSKFPYIFVDEFQDTNPIQTTIIKNLALSSSIVGVIGDKNQSIYGFQGAKPQDFIDFNISNIGYYQILENYRSTKAIIKCLNAISNGSQKHIKEGDSRPNIIICNDPSNVITYVQNTFNLNNNLSSVFLTRTNKDLSKLKYCSRNINYTESDLWEDFFTKDKDRFYFIKGVLISYQYAIDKKYELAVKEFLKLFKRKPLKDIKNELTQKSITIDLLEFLIMEELQSKSLKDFYDLVSEKLTKYNITCQRYSSRGGPVDFANSTNVENLINRLKINEYKSEFLTIHGSKGTEFDIVTVFIFDSQRGRGIYTAQNKLKDYLTCNNINGNEENRIKYVAFSRAKKILNIIIPQLDSAIETQLLNTNLYQIVKL